MKILTEDIFAFPLLLQNSLFCSRELETDKEVFYLLVHSLSGFNGQGRARGFIQIAYVGAEVQIFGPTSTIFPGSRAAKAHRKCWHVGRNFILYDTGMTPRHCDLKLF